jgi:hypothetical protein
MRRQMTVKLKLNRTTPYSSTISLSTVESGAEPVPSEPAMPRPGEELFFIVLGVVELAVGISELFVEMVMKGRSSMGQPCATSACECVTV